MRTPKNLPRHELIGLDVEVVETQNRDEKNITGKIVDETKKTLKIKTEEDEKTVQKKGRSFEFSLPSGESVKIDGDVLFGRPEERIGKRLKKW